PRRVDTIKALANDDQARGFGIDAAENRPQLMDRDAEVVGAALDGYVCPEVVDEHFLRDHPASLQRQESEQESRLPAWPAVDGRAAGLHREGAEEVQPQPGSRSFFDLHIGGRR